MSTYLMSDIHGDMPSFQMMLKKIDFKRGEDFLIINGDVLDRGEEGLEIILMIKEMVENNDAILIKGDHELYAQMYLEGTLSEKNWIKNYGEATLNSIKALNDEERAGLLEFIKKLPLYTERDIPRFGKTVITHTGLTNFKLIKGFDEVIDVAESIRQTVETDELDLLNSADIHYWRHEQLDKLDKFIICGHVPTYQLGQEFTGRIFKTRRYMDIDAGAGYRNMGGRLACYSIDDEKEFYV